MIIKLFLLTFFMEKFISANGCLPNGNTSINCTDASNNCLNGGTCLDNKNFRSSCTCMPGYFGSRCEYSIRLSNGAIAGISISAALLLIVCSIGILTAIIRCRRRILAKGNRKRKISNISDEKLRNNSLSNESTQSHSSIYSTIESFKIPELEI